MHYRGFPRNPSVGRTGQYRSRPCGARIPAHRTAGTGTARYGPVRPARDNGENRVAAVRSPSPRLGFVWQPGARTVPVRGAGRGEKRSGGEVGGGGEPGLLFRGRQGPGRPAQARGRGAQPRRRAPTAPRRAHLPAAEQTSAEIPALGATSTSCGRSPGRI